MSNMYKSQPASPDACRKRIKHGMSRKAALNAGRSNLEDIALDVTTQNGPTLTKRIRTPYPNIGLVAELHTTYPEPPETVNLKTTIYHHPANNPPTPDKYTKNSLQSPQYIQGIIEELNQTIQDNHLASLRNNDDNTNPVRHAMESYRNGLVHLAMADRELQNSGYHAQRGETTEENTTITYEKTFRNEDTTNKGIEHVYGLALLDE